MMRTAEEQQRERIDDERHALFSASFAPKRQSDGKIDGNCREWSSALESASSQLGSGFLIALIGPRGTGKTKIAVEVIRANSVNRKSSKYYKAIEVFVRIKGAYNAKATESESEALEAFQKPAFLVLDEMSERGESQWEERMLRLIIDKRYDAGKDTLLLGNYAYPELAKSVGDSVASRIQETGGVIECNWKSFRAR